MKDYSNKERNNKTLSKEKNNKEEKIYLLKKRHYEENKEEKTSNTCFNPITPLVMVFARRSRKNHANPSLRSGTGVKG
jgi:hypothetical protein